MSRTFTPLVGSISSEPYLVGHKWGYQTAEKVRQGLDVAIYLGTILDFGGSDDVGQLTASYTPVRGYRDYSLNVANLGGVTTDAVIYYRTDASTTSVTVRIRNVTTAANAGVGTLSTSTTIVKEVIALTLTGTSDYRLEVTGSDAVNAVYAYGYLRLRHIPT